MRRRSPYLLVFLSLASVGWIALTYRLLRAPDIQLAQYYRHGVQTKLEGLELDLRDQKAEIQQIFQGVQTVRETRQQTGGLRTNISLPQLPLGSRLQENAIGVKGGAKRVIPILLFACNRVTVRKPIEQLLALRPSAERFPIIASADCSHQLTLNTIRSYGNQVQLIQQPDQSEYKLPLKQKKFKGYYAIARHYGWALNKTFVDLNYDAAIIVEDDLEVSPDFFSYFESLLPILEADPTLYCVSAWNDNGKAGLIDQNNASLLHRSDFFPGLGWMLTRRLWTEELMMTWPKAFWDDWIREPAQRRNRACIRPEISRTKTFGKIGVSNGLFFEKHLKYIQLNTQPIDFSQRDLTYLLKDNYDVEFVKEVYGSPVVALPSILSGSIALPMSRAVRLTYRSQTTFKRLAKALSIMDDFKSGVPRTGYRGVVSCMHNGRRVYVAPPAEWNGYDPKWSR
ncbi:alpha-1,3-mannosyl-glycoprotein 2-beta-N-acetylglucosaminyltransferase-like [Varroa destructor]|uniref:Alpha-1,3-mannosyl-glycoprotein 2-beta-N-acetylglucosaminyltransferase n=1 Tax=Varroa destructor TaxID=109461 RepID=A0A7M7KFE1_VARDE|nr:alpha-1,3-mannosyl-glycoprotein 2-beta-N-acetylglucosaminyltransferase-like [Varroa destructor]